MHDTTGQKYIGGRRLAGTLAALLTVLATSSLLALAVNADELSSAPEAANGAQQAIAANQSAALSWQHDYKKALSMAGGSGKLVLIDLYTDWCGWCKKLDRDTFTNADVQTFLNKQFILLKLNAEDGADGETLAKKFHVRGYPCAIILDAQGKLKGSIYGYYSPSEYPDEISKALKKG